MKRAAVFSSLLCLGIAFSCQSTRADPENCGRLKAGDNFNRINEILDCIESKIRTSLSPLPPAANSASSGSPLRLPPPSGVAKEPNNGIYEATEIPFGSSMKGKITERDPVDWYVFKTPDDVGDQFLVIYRYIESGGGGGNYVYIEVYDANEQKIAGEMSWNSIKSLRIQGNKESIYYIKVYGNVNVSYEMAIRNKTADAAR